MRPRLRLFNDHPFDGPEEVVAPEVTVSLGELIHVLRDSVQKGRIWIDDFADEDIKVSQDLYEILAAYRRMSDAA